MQLPRNEKRRLKSLFMATLQPVKNLAFQSNLGASSGLSSYDDSEEEDFSGIGAGTDQSVLKTVPWYEQVGKAAAGLAVPLATYQLEKQRNKINLQRAKQGLDPIETGATATVGLSSDTKKLIYVGIGSLALIVLLPKLMK